MFTVFISEAFGINVHGQQHVLYWSLKTKGRNGNFVVTGGTATSDATSNDKVGIVTTLVFQWSLMRRRIILETIDQYEKDYTDNNLFVTV